MGHGKCHCKPGRRETLERSEAEFDAALGRVHAIETEARPHQRDDHQGARVASPELKP